jgi:hypothetical protein
MQLATRSVCVLDSNPDRLQQWLGVRNTPAIWKKRRQLKGFAHADPGLGRYLPVAIAAEGQTAECAAPAPLPPVAIGAEEHTPEGAAPTPLPPADPGGMDLE